MSVISQTDLLINSDGSIYHLNLMPDQLADTVIIVGDPDRVPEISFYFDRVDHRVRNREFISHTGVLKGKAITALSTGIGTDNIDIVLNELDALANIDFITRTKRPVHRTLEIIRLGTSGAIQPDIPVGTFLLSTYGLGLDNLMRFYQGYELLEEDLLAAFMQQTGWNIPGVSPYFVKGSDVLIDLLRSNVMEGITVTSPGFYGPQGRILRLPLYDPEMNEKLQRFRFNNQRIINFEMETSALYGVGRLLGHNVVTVCALIANRATHSYSNDHKWMIKSLIEMVLDKIISPRKY